MRRRTQHNWIDAPLNTLRTLFSPLTHLKSKNREVKKMNLPANLQLNVSFSKFLNHYFILSIIEYFPY